MVKSHFFKKTFSASLLIVFVLGALLAATTEAPYGGWFQIPILSLTWWILDAQKIKPAKQFFALGFLFGLGYFVVGLWWLYISLHDVGGMHSMLSSLAVLILSAYLAIYFSLACLSIRLFKTSRLTGLFLAASWVASEYLRGQIFTGFPWMGLAEAQVNGPFGSIAPYTGALGCTFLTIYTSSLLFTYKRFSLVNSLSILAVGFITFLCGQWHFTQPTGKPITVELLQGNFAQSLIFKPEGIIKQIEFYKSAMLHSHAELTISPETAFPWPEKNLPIGLLNSLQHYSDQSGHNLVFGVIGQNIPASNGREYANRALGIAPNSQPYQYDKNHLVPFGEFIPPGFHWFVNAFHVPLSDFSRGGNHQPNLVITRKNQADIYAAITICYEDVFGGELAMRLRQSEPPVNLLINMTNLAWFGQSQAPAQQLRLSQLRSLETGLPALRATNTGITAILGPDGKVLQSLPEFVQGSLKGQIQPYIGITPYVRWGDFPILSISCLLLIWGFVRHRRF